MIFLIVDLTRRIGSEIGTGRAALSRGAFAGRIREAALAGQKPNAC